ncbi:WXG100 family type VII secretion target [Aeromicrobium wangtongii]|uniref:WXG100 family type VII secretion target n=1 Tax=Aeromicrobium wangtongii TaxID=2969247 RepID=UPI002017FF8C|nr:hypothetical protein [Aeromicrobium wangtongii]MCL3816872.1 hypothetical protein [Aeromicrobium wangtongii]
MASTSAADYPALGFDPAPGDAEAVEEAASTLRSVKRALEDVAALLDGAPIDEWHGAVATAFDDLFRLELRPVLETAGTALEDSRRALDGWATDLRHYQRRARDLEVEAARAQQQAAAAASELDDVPVPDDASDPPSAERRGISQRITRADEGLAQHRSDAQALLTEYTDAGAAVGRLLEGAQEAAPVDLRRLTGLSGVAAIVVGSMTGPEGDQYLRDHPEAGALLLELRLRSEGLLDGAIESDAYRTWLENAARRGVSAETILDIARTHDIGPDDFAVLDGLEEVKDRDGKSFFVLPDDISDDDARKAVLMTYILNAGTDYGSASTDNDFDETPYSADEVQRIIDRQERNDWSYKDDVDFVHGNGGRLVTTPNGMLMGLGGQLAAGPLQPEGRDHVGRHLHAEHRRCRRPCCGAAQDGAVGTFPLPAGRRHDLPRPARSRSPAAPRGGALPAVGRQGPQWIPPVVHLGADPPQERHRGGRRSEGRRLPMRTSSRHIAAGFTRAVSTGLRVVIALGVLGVVLFLARCDRTNQLAPSLPQVVGLRVDGEQLQIVTGTPCEGVDRIDVLFSGGVDKDGKKLPRGQLVASSGRTVEQVTVGSEVVVPGFTMTEALPTGFDWRDYSEMDVGFVGPDGDIGGATSDLEPVKADGVKHSGDGTAYVRREGWLTLPEIIDGNTKSFLTACTPDPADKQ